MIVIQLIKLQILLFTSSGWKKKNEHTLFIVLLGSNLYVSICHFHYAFKSQNPASVGSNQIARNIKEQV